MNIHKNIIQFQPPAAIGDGVGLGDRKISTPSVFLVSTLSTTRSQSLHCKMISNDNLKVSKHNLHCQCIILILNGNLKVFLILWWWFLLLVLIGLVRLVYRAVQCRSRSCLLYQGNFFYCLVAGPPGCVTISSRWDSTRTSRSQRRSSRSRSLSRLRNSAIGELICGWTTIDK